MCDKSATTRRANDASVPARVGRFLEGMRIETAVTVPITRVVGAAVAFPRDIDDSVDLLSDGGDGRAIGRRRGCLQ